MWTKNQAKVVEIGKRLAWMLALTPKFEDANENHVCILGHSISRNLLNI
jgi:hypothetical protein